MRLRLEIHLGRMSDISKTEALFVLSASTKIHSVTPLPNATKTIHLKEDFIPFVKKLKFLGTWIVPSLLDEYGIKKRITSTKITMHSLESYFQNSTVSLKVKKLIFLSIPVNILLRRV